MSARILIVDDNPLNVRLTASTLEYAGYSTMPAADAECARAILDAGERIDLILMDVSLPRMDGLTLTRLLKAQSHTARIPIVILTASAMPGDEEVARNAGADGYITKPIDVRVFPQVITGYLKSTG